MTVVVGSPPYLRSCGISPTDATWKIRLRAPSVVRPASTTWGPITVPGPARTSGPTIENAPTSTSAASSAPGSTSAVAWMRGTSPALRAVGGIAQRGEQLGLGDELAVDERAHRVLAHAAHLANQVGLERQPVAGKHAAAEARAVDAREEEQRAVARPAAGGAPGEDRGELRERLDDEHGGHYREFREMTLEERLVHRDVLDASNRRRRNERRDAVEEEHGIPVRQVLHDLADVHAPGVGCRHSPSPPFPRSSAFTRSASERSLRSSTATCLHSLYGRIGKTLL